MKRLNKNFWLLGFVMLLMIGSVSAVWTDLRGNANADTSGFVAFLKSVWDWLIFWK